MASFTNTVDKKEYECIVVGAGVSGLKVAKDLIVQYGVSADNILMLEAMNYIGGRVTQDTKFIKGVKVELGAEILHGKNTPLTDFAKEHGEIIDPIYVWAHGDGGPLPTPVNGAFGLYYTGKGNGEGRLMRYDENDEEFQRLNETLWAMENMDLDTLCEKKSVLEYLRDDMKFGEEMIGIANAGYANTLCCNIEQLSLKQSARWNGFWHEESEEDGDFKYRNSYSCLVDYLKSGVNVRTNAPVKKVDVLPQANDSKLVKLTTLDGTEYTTKAAVIAVPPFVFRSDYISFTPALPENKFLALDYTYMHAACKVFVKFSKVIFPTNVHGMIMTDPDFLFPEIWFRDVSHLINPEEEDAVCYATGFCTSKFAETILSMPCIEVYARLCKQLDTVFSHLEARHFTAEGDLAEKPELAKASECFLGGKIQAWDPKTKPFIGGGYSAPKAGYPTTANDLLGEPVDDVLFFAGEATNVGPAGTAHAALAAGIRCAEQVSDYLKAQK